MQQESQQLCNSSVLEQQALIPEIYGSVDFGQLPERYVRDFDLETLRPSRHRDYCERVLEIIGRQKPSFRSAIGPKVVSKQRCEN